MRQSISVLAFTCGLTFGLILYGSGVKGQAPTVKKDLVGWADQPLLNNYTIEDGLPTHWVRGALEDHNGFIWLGTAGGLTRFDGHNFRLYPYKLDDDLDIGADRVLDLVLDNEGEIWISRLYRPLERFNPKTEQSYSYASRNTALPVDQIYDLFFDPPHFIWIGHSVGGLVSRINKKTGEIISFQVDPDIIMDHNDKVWDLFRDQDGELWAATNHGLYQFDSVSSGFKPYQFVYHGVGQEPAYFDNINDFKAGKLILESTLGPTILDKKSHSVSPLLKLPKPYRSSVNGYFIRDRNFLWIANPQGMSNNQGGIVRYNLQTDEVVYYTLDSNIPLLRDGSGIIWLHNGSKGVSSFKPGKRKFSSYDYPFEDSIASVIHHKQGIFWVGTDKGLYQLELDGAGLTTINDFSTKFQGVSSLLQAADSSLWVASSSGLERYFPNGAIRKYLNDLKPGSIEKSALHPLSEIYEDKNGTIWASGSMLVEISPETGAYKLHTNSSINELRGTTEDFDGNLWFTNVNGVMVFNQEKSQFFNLKVPYSGSIKSVYLDLQNAWIGTNTGLYGMRLTDFDSLVFNYDRIECYNHLLPENFTVTVKGTKNALWVLFPRGLLKTAKDHQRLETFDKKDGLSTEILAETLVDAFFDHDEDLYLAWPSNLTRFRSKQTPYNVYVPPVVITDLKIFNQSVGIRDTLSGKPVLNRAIFDTKTLELPYRTSFSLEFSALDYTNPEMNKFRYRMEGIDEDWSPADLNRTVTYAELSPGHYTFKVIASNSDGLWNHQGSSLNIVINPPWWKTWWAYSIFSLSGLGLIIGLIYYEKKRFVLRQKAKSLEEINQAKNDFFTNISHELRTPLTLITGPLRALRAGTFKGDSAALLDMMSHNGDRMLRLVNQLLDLTKIDRGKMQLHCEHQNLTELLRSVVASFHSAASMKNISLTFDYSIDDIHLLIDTEKIRQVFFNLLSNAIKFTPEGGEVVLSTLAEDKVVRVMVRDSGVGIPEKEQRNIFDRFYQISYDNQNDYEGSGIGLELAQQLVHLHHGTIEVSSKPGVGSTFTVTLPWQQPEFGHKAQIRQKVEKSRKPQTRLKAKDATGSQYPVLLIVEDNAQMREYLRICLGEDFHFLEAGDGVEGFALADQHIPDLILCDVMMPGMDGYEFCDKIRNRNSTAHIPFIFITAKTDQDSLLKGLELGSDDYLTKPFGEVELRLKVRNHLDKMNQYRKFFGRQLTLKGDIETVVGIDQKFLQLAVKTVEDQLENHEFSVQEFAKKLGLSHAQLYRKLLTLTGLSPNSFIRSIRLKKAAQLIIQNYGNTSEVAYAVGFNNLSYFTKCFKQQFGLVPSAYKKKYQSTHHD